jgi:toxin ParE1/3/4
VTFNVILTPEAEGDLQQIQDYIAAKSFPDNAAAYVSRLLDRLETLGTAPFRGTSRDDIGPGFRTTGFEHRATILYAIRGNDVIIAGVYQGGQQVPKFYRL